MKFGWPVSLILHAALIFGGLIAFSNGVKPIEAGRFIPVEIVSISDLTNIKAAKKIKPKQEISEPETPMRIETPARPAEDIGKETLTQVEPMSAEAAASSITDFATPDKDVVSKEKETPPEAPVFDLDKMAALIDKSRSTQPVVNKEQALSSDIEQYEFAKMAREGAGLQTELSMSEVDALRSRMYKCWRVSADARDSQDLIVRVRVQLFPDGSVQRVDLLDQAKINASSNAYLQIAAERALRAVSKCAPYDFLPQEKYGSWKDMELTFQPEI